MTQKSIMQGLASTVLAITLTVSMGSVALADQSIVDQRIQMMKKMGGAMRALSAFARGGDYDDRLTEAAAAISETSGAIPRLFPPMTGRGQIDKDTRALPTIWSDPAGFIQQTAALQAAAKQIEQAVAAQSAAGVGAGLKAAGATCGACHKPYRAPK